MQKAFLKTIQSFVAITAMGPSSLRNQGGEILKRAQNFCSNLNLQNYSNLNKKQFEQRLDQDTKRLIAAIKLRNKPWGTARKALNLFLRDALYNKYLSKQYTLESIESFFEIPLDSIVSQSLIKISKTEKLPKWPGLKYLTKETSDKFQEFALKLAKEKYHISRVHLDIHLWTKNR